MKLASILALSAALPAAFATPAAAETLHLRLAQSAPAPWGEGLMPESLPIGTLLRLEDGRLSAPPPLGCEPATVERLAIDAEGLFEGNLSPAHEAAERLGFGTFPVPVLRVVCPNLSVDLAFADAETALLALDNRILTFSSAPGAVAADGTPEAATQQFLEAHLAGDTGFWPESVGWKAHRLTSRLSAAAAAYFATPRPADEVPPINGDPFTDSQEYPTRFAVGPGTVEDATATVPVRFADAWQERRLSYLLVDDGDGWRVDDVVAEDGTHLSDLLAE